MKPTTTKLAATALLAALLYSPTFAQTVIPSGNFTTPYVANSNATTYLVNAGDTRINSGAAEVVTFGNSAGNFTLNVNGTLSGTGAGRGIRTTNNNVNFTVTVSNTGIIRATSDDAIQARNGVFNLTNNGTIYSGPNIALTPTAALATGQALDLASAVGGTVINNATGVIRADGHDAVRLGNNMSMLNYGSIRGNAVVNDSPANNGFNTPPTSTNTTEAFSASEGVSFENGINSSLDNYGSISGSRHGVETDVSAANITITNRSTGEMIGRNGSGIGSDATSSNISNIVVHNHGVIRGDFAGSGNVTDRTGSLSPTQDGDGDGVDVDGAATINNYTTGQIIGNGANGFDSGGRANTSDGIAIGGGTVYNEGLIRGTGVGIVVNNDTVLSRSGVAATTITNKVGATIEGLNGYAIRLENKLGDARDNDVLVNEGTINGNGSIPDPLGTTLRQNGLADPNSTGTLDGVAYTGTGSTRFIRGDGSAIQMGQGNDSLTNTGTINGNTGRAINMEGGNDTVTFNGGTINGSINGGTGTDTLELASGISSSSAIQNFETFKVGSGSATLNGVVSGNGLNKTGAGTLNLTGNNTYTGGTTVTTGTLKVNNTSGSATGNGTVNVSSGALIGGAGKIDGDLVASGIVTPGNSIGTLTVGGNVTWNGDLANAWAFELGVSGNSDSMNILGDLIKGSGSNFTFDFLGTGSAGTFVLLDWAGNTSFTAADFTYINLGGAQPGSFNFNGSQLEFTVIPEPSTFAALFGAATLAVVVWRKRKKSL